MAKTTGKVEKKIFKQGNTPYYWSSRLFSAKYRGDIYALYSFVQTADDYVDSQPAQPKKLLDLQRSFEKAIADPAFDSIALNWDEIDERVIKHIVRLTHKYKFDPDWVRAFFEAMKQDIDSQGYANIDETLRYIYGSAEVIGLMVAKIMNLPEESFEIAKSQARAMQWINFIRDIAEDGEQGRVYFPRNDLRKYNLKDLSRETVMAQQADFKRFINFQLKRYDYWQRQADANIESLPRKPRAALKAAVEMYTWTAKKIEQDPLIVFDKKVKPRKIRLVWSGTKRATNKAARLFAAQQKTAIKK